MATSRRIRQLRILLIGLTFVLLTSGLAAASAFAATTTTFQAFFKEETTFGACPPGTPQPAQCFSGHSTFGEATPPGGPASESFRGFVDLTTFDPTTNCATDHSAAAITTRRGKLFLIAEGRTCQTPAGTAEATGNWTAVGGTGIFDGARGMGTFTTVGTINGNKAESTTTYAGELTLR